MHDLRRLWSIDREKGKNEVKIGIFEVRSESLKVISLWKNWFDRSFH